VDKQHDDDDDDELRIGDLRVMTLVQFVCPQTFTGKGISLCNVIKD